MSQKPREWTLWYGSKQSNVSISYPQPMFDGPEISEDTKVVEANSYAELQKELEEKNEMLRECEGVLKVAKTGYNEISIVAVEKMLAKLRGRK